MIPKATYRKILELVPIVCVDLVIVNKNKCLLVKRNNEPAKGQYWFPGGRVYKMETIEKAALRKAREEVNLKCAFHKIVSIEETIFRKKKGMDTDVHSMNIICQLKPLSVKDVKVDQFHSDSIWVNLKTAKGLSLHPAVLNPIQKCLRG